MISTITSAAVRPGPAQEVRAAERPQAAQAAPSQAAGLRPLRDEYVPEEKRQEPWGRYWLEKDGDGGLKVHFDDPEAPEDAPAAPEEDEKKPEDAAPGKEAPEKAAPPGGERGAERCTCNTDKVDRELEKLRKKRAELEKQLASETDGAKAGELERKLSQAENELRQKDNDAYRRRRAVFTEG